MHIPDGFLNLQTAAVTGVLSVGGLAYALRRTGRTLPPRKVPLLGLAAAFVFAAQMLNFPVAGGTSGHLIGATLTAVLLGPFAAVVVTSSVLIVQCFLFADGGITALGANIFNMAIVGAVVGWAIYRPISRMVGGQFGKVLAASFAAWCSTMIASIVCAGELASSGIVHWKIAFTTMAGVHALIGIGEGIITALVLSTVAANRPDLLTHADARSPSRERSYQPILIYGGLISLGLAIFVAPFASSSPDGLDKTAESLGFADRARVIWNTPLADYQAFSFSSDAVRTALAGAIGAIVVFILAWVLSRVIVKPLPEVVDPKSAAESV